MSLKIDSICFSYNHSRVLNDITLDIAKGSFCAVLGCNGSGKTTFLKCINRLLIPDSGCISIDGQDIKTLSQNEIAKQISYVPQEHDNIASYSVLDVIVMGFSPYLGVGQLPNSNHYNHVKEVLANLNASYLENKLFNQISGGERQIALIARALVQNSQIILLDEPTNHLDFSRKSLLLKLLKRICIEEQKTIITTTHDPNLITAIADQVIMFKNGEVYCQGSSCDTLSRTNISEVYDVHVNTFTADNGKVFFYAE